MRAAVEIISGPLGEDRDDKSVMDEYRELCEGGRIRFVTFHQSYGYEEFVEGIRPVMGSGDDSGDIRYEVVDGALKEFCDKSREFNEGSDCRDVPKIWKTALANDQASGDIHKDCLNKGYICFNFDIDKKIDLQRLKHFKEKMHVGDYVLSSRSDNEIDAIGVVTGDYESSNEFGIYKHVRKVEWKRKFNEGERPNLGAISDKDDAAFSTGALHISRPAKLERIRELIGDSRPRSTKGNSVFIIDEINRGNISSIFGELITLVEPAKRAGMVESMQVTLPYSRKEFSVPDNVYIIGTMNTADRSLVSMDVAPRRRFDFIEVMPEPDLLKNTVEGIDLKSLLETVNGRIEALYDREHMLGHSYFMGIENTEGLKNVLKNKVIPLLRDYFHEDYEKIGFVLSEKGNHDKSPFINENKPNCFDEDYNKEIRTYRIVYPDKADSHISIYDDKS